MIGALTLDQLRVLVTIADSGSFSSAGRHLNRVQSAISQTIATLEAAQGVTLFDRSGHRPRLTDAGRVLVAQARGVLASAAQFEAMAASTRDGLEPELTLAIDPLVPSAPLIDSLRALNTRHPHLPVSFSTEGLGGALRRLRTGRAALAIGLLLPEVPPDVTASALFSVDLVPVVAPTHPLAMLGHPATGADLASHVQLVLSDPEATDGPNHGIASLSPWRFLDLGRRMDFLLAGFGWCRMPRHMVEGAIADGRLVTLALEEDRRPPLIIYSAHLAGRVPGPAGRWLMDDLRTRLRGGS